MVHHANIPPEGHHGREKRSSLSENLSIMKETTFST